MFKNSKVKKSAWKFLDYLFTKEPRVEFTTTEGFLADHQRPNRPDPAFNDPDTSIGRLAALRVCTDL